MLFSPHSSSLSGLSIPYAMENRRRKGDSSSQYISACARSWVRVAVDGVFLVNGESINESATGMHRLVYNIICCTCFIVLWNCIQNLFLLKLINVLKVIAAMVLVILAYIYRGGGTEQRFSPQWWGILGLIGWALPRSSEYCSSCRKQPG